MTDGRERAERGLRARRLLGVLALRTGMLGRDHPDTFLSMNNLAFAHHAAGRTDEALALFQQVLRERVRVLSPSHPDTMTSAHNVAFAYAALGRTGEAIALYRDVLARRETLLGHDHPDTVRTRQNLTDIEPRG